MIDDEAVDGGLEIDDGLENPALERGLVRMAKPSTALSQLAEVGVKWNIQRGMSAQPFDHLGMLVGGVVCDFASTSLTFPFKRG